LVYGSETLHEELSGLTFQVQMPSFFQTNPASAERLYAEVVKAVEHERPEGVVLDLFCGTGTMAQLIARGTTAEVVGVELVPSAVEDARMSAERNNLQRVAFHAADVGKFLEAHPEYMGRIACAVVDPPRAGIAPKTLQKIAALGAARIVYVSCNPATQARDVDLLEQWGYRLKQLQLVDQFPHTAHVETIAIFEPA
jgi:23S rRNA (uracil-5-)-methyltransferase RumA